MAMALGPQLILEALRIGVFFSIPQFRPSITTSSPHPVYCPFRSVLEYKQILLVDEILRKSSFIGENKYLFFSIRILHKMRAAAISN